MPTIVPYNAAIINKILNITSKYRIPVVYIKDTNSYYNAIITLVGNSLSGCLIPDRVIITNKDNLKKRRLMLYYSPGKNIFECKDAIYSIRPINSKTHTIFQTKTGILFLNKNANIYEKINRICIICDL